MDKSPVHCESSNERKIPSRPSEIGVNDVVCGKDSLSHSSPGNKRFRDMIQAYRQSYQQTRKREDKQRIVGFIINEVERTGGRFMKLDQSQGVWLALDTPTVHGKVSHALRSAKESSSRSRARKRRKEDNPVASKEEDEAFNAILSEQQVIFSTLMQQQLTQDDGAGEASDHRESDEETVTGLLDDLYGAFGSGIL